VTESTVHPEARHVSASTASKVFMTKWEYGAVG
jgi:hypothetical protein